MSMDTVKIGLVVVLIVFVIVRAFVRRRARTVESEEEEEEKLLTPASSRVRLTELQRVALCSASLAPIYVENRSGPMSPDREAYSLRTIESLVERGLIESDGNGGYTATREGLDAWEG